MSMPGLFNNSRERGGVVLIEGWHGEFRVRLGLRVNKHVATTNRHTYVFLHGFHSKWQKIVIL